ncbi:UNVERIFIED_CONTAM: Retrovirus-related Pol polyprotein from transposon RE1 [Sesamum radiatum]|uniref:Retrovirus-related Pol polyprotein from transposon RE1 n=1 Tax=Sesamum radiatum TaxID=300843 RepID=A0AAW2L0Z8_SESRA
MTESIAAETITNRAAEAAQYEKDILYIHPSEHSGLALTSTPLDGTNFLAWQRAVYVSLGTKMKLGFIDGSFPCPAVGTLHYEQWRRVDLTVTSWIWNSLSKDIVEAFMYCATSHELWTAIQRRKPGHTHDARFQLHGVPDWYKVLNDKKKKGKHFTAAAVDDKQQSPELAASGNMFGMMNELIKLLKKNSAPSDPITNYANFVSFDDQFAATFLINHTPTPLLRWKTPYELLYGTQPAYDLLKVFGSLCYATNIDPQKMKFHSRAIKCVMIGYGMHKKAYKLFDLENRKVFYSRDVHFYEHIFLLLMITPSVLHLLLLYLLYSTHSDDISFPIVSDVQAIPPPSSPSTLTPSSGSPLSSSAIPSLPQAQAPQLRRSLRQIQKPSWLDDFVSYSHTSKLISSSNAAYLSFVASLSILQEPRSFSEAVLHQEWRDAMNVELEALEKNKTWKLTALPSGKAAHRLQMARNWPLHQLDVNNAFLHGHLDEDIYMTPPEGYHVSSGLVCKLEKSLYGLKQASRQWNVELTLKLKQFGFVQSAHDHCLFTWQTASGLLMLLVYVDDILVTGPSLTDIQFVKDHLHQLFTIKDIGVARYFLGLEIARGSSGIYVAQTKYIMDIVKDLGLLEAKAVSTLLPMGLKLTADCGALLINPDSYRRLIGRLLYLAFTRPDISHSVQQLSQFLTHPCEAHWKAALHIVRYLKGSPALGIFFPSSSSFELTAYCDADWASCPDSRRSLSGFCIFLGGALVSWKTKKQSTVSRSTAEAEYRSMAATVCELKWLSYVLADLGVSVSLPIPLFCDNQAALHIMANPVFHERTKHIELDCHVVRDAYKSGFVAPSHVRSALQLADLFTKILPLKLFADLISKLGLVTMSPSPTCGGAVEFQKQSGDSAAAIVDKLQLKVAGEGEDDEEDILDKDDDMSCFHSSDLIMYFTFLASHLFALHWATSDRVC